MIALDTNVLARYYVASSDAPSQKQSAAARKLLESGKSLFVSKTVVLELEWVLRGYYKSPPEDVLAVLREELQALANIPAEVRDTTLVVVPHCLHDFLDFNDFLGDVDDVVHAMGLEGTLQVASFHPQFQFAGTDADDVTNCTNRAPYPTLHLLREASIDRAVSVFPDAEAIFERNMEVLEEMGMAGWLALDVGPHDNGGKSVAGTIASDDIPPTRGPRV